MARLVDSQVGEVQLTLRQPGDAVPVPCRGEAGHRGADQRAAALDGDGMTTAGRKPEWARRARHRLVDTELARTVAAANTRDLGGLVAREAGQRLSAHRQRPTTTRTVTAAATPRVPTAPFHCQGSPQRSDWAGGEREGRGGRRVGPAPLLSGAFTAGSEDRSRPPRHRAGNDQQAVERRCRMTNIDPNELRVGDLITMREIFIVTAVTATHIWAGPVSY